MTPDGNRHPRVLHLTDAAADRDPLLGVALSADPASRVLARHLADPILRWRAARELRRRPADAVVAWGEAAAEVARRAPTAAGAFYRPGGAPRRLALPWAGARALADSPSQARRLRRAGWPASAVTVLPPPVLFDAPHLTRRDLGADAGDVLWLAAAEGDATAGLRAAVWAATILHVVDLAPPRRRRHRLVVVGDAHGHRLAKRFADQLGLAGLCLGVARFGYADVARLCDAAVLLPEGPTGAHSAAVVAAVGLPAVVNGRPELGDFLANRPGVRVVTSPKPRVVAREMLRLETGRPRGVPRDGRARDEAAWRRALDL